jgi:hypothetical protein
MAVCSKTGFEDKEPEDSECKSVLRSATAGNSAAISCP